MNEKKNTGLIALVAGVIAVGIFFLMRKPAGAVPLPPEYPPAHPKFKVGDHLTYKVPAPTNVIYVVVAVFPGPAPDYGFYTLGQWWYGEVLIVQAGFSVAVFDDNYVLVK